jgi:rhodanese-related sulfurtransferase
VRTPIGENLFADPALDLDPAEALRRQAAGELDIVDIREQYEWDAGRAPGTSHTEIERVASRAPALDRARPVAFMCRGGVRAGMVAQAFRAIGFDAYNVAGGFTAWHAQGLPTEPGGAVVADH